MTQPTILIVDDDPVARTVMRAGLQSGGFNVVEAADGEEALEYCERARADLLIVDVIMPRLGGFDLCRALRRQPDWAYVPILMSTTLDDVASISEAYEAGATDFVTKPAQWLILNHRVRYMLRASETVTELRRARERALKAMNAAEAADRAKSKFLANMGHELRTPLNAIIGFSEVIRDATFGALPEKYTEYAGPIGQSGTHLLGMISDILDFSKAETQSMALAEESIDVDHMVTTSIGVIEDMARAGGVSYSQDVEPKLPALRADPVKLRQVLINLLSNAVKFTPAGGTVSLTVAREAQNGMTFRIADTGIGISPEKVALASRAFGDLQGDSRHTSGGLGLGLPLTMRLVELHGGKVAIQSAPGAGTVVTVSFPQERLQTGPMPA